MQHQALKDPALRRTGRPWEWPSLALGPIAPTVHQKLVQIQSEIVYIIRTYIFDYPFLGADGTTIFQAMLGEVDLWHR
jgi:hypothetical protein